MHNWGTYAIACFSLTNKHRNECVLLKHTDRDTHAHTQTHRVKANKQFILHNAVVMSQHRWSQLSVASNVASATHATNTTSTTFADTTQAAETSGQAATQPTECQRMKPVVGLVVLVVRVVVEGRGWQYNRIPGHKHRISISKQAPGEGTSQQQQHCQTPFVNLLPSFGRYTLASLQTHPPNKNTNLLALVSPSMSRTWISSTCSDNRQENASILFPSSFYFPVQMRNLQNK